MIYQKRSLFNSAHARQHCVLWNKKNLRENSVSTARTSHPNLQTLSYHLITAYTPPHKKKQQL